MKKKSLKYIHFICFSWCFIACEFKAISLKEQKVDLVKTEYIDVLSREGKDIRIMWSEFNLEDLKNHELRTYTNASCTSGELYHGRTNSKLNNDSTTISGLTDGLYWFKVNALDSLDRSYGSYCSKNFITVNKSAVNIPTNGLKLWLDIDQKKSIFLSSDCSGDHPLVDESVGCILDLSGRSNNARQTNSSLRPIFKVGVQNGRNALHFTNSALEIDNEKEFDFTTEFTIFFGFRVDSLKTVHETFYSKGDQTFSFRRNYIFKSTVQDVGVYPQPSFHRLASSIFIDDNTFRLSTSTYKNGVREWYFNGLMEASDTAPNISLNFNDFKVCLGCDLEDTARNLRNSYVVEFLIYNRKLNPSEISSVESYMLNKWQ